MIRMDQGLFAMKSTYIGSIALQPLFISSENLTYKSGEFIKPVSMGVQAPSKVIILYQMLMKFQYQLPVSPQLSYAS